MGRRRDPKLLSQYLCAFCGQQVVWGELLRILRTDPGQPAYQGWEFYAHKSCARAAMRKEVPLALARHWDGKPPLPDDSHQIDGQPCGICAGAIAPPDLTRLRIQHLAGPVKRPEFDEESVPVHTACLRARAH
jgi:hypothetical protein